MTTTADHDSGGLSKRPRTSKEILLSYLIRYSLPFLLALLFLSLESVCDLLQPTIMSRVLDEGVSTGNNALVIALGLRMIGVAAIGAIGAIGRNIVASVVAYKFAARLRADLFSTMIHLQAVTADGFDAASLVTRQTNDVNQVQTFVNGMMRIFAKAPIVCIGSLIMANRLEPTLAPIALAAVLVVSLLVVLNMKLGFPMYVTVQKALDSLNAAARSFLGGVRVVKAFDRFGDEATRFGATSQSLADSSRRAAKVAAIFGPASAITVNLGLVAILWLGGLRVRLGEVPVGKVVAFISYMTQILFALTVISHVFSWFVRASASWKRIRELFDSAAAAGAATGSPGRSAALRSAPAAT